jgi:hypothetical protein
MMEHFSEQIWADFVRGTDNPGAHAELESHLAEGCKDCAASWQFWQQVQEIAAHENKHSPPEAAVRMAKVQLVASCAHETQEITATLTFDTISQPLLAGVRSMAAAAARQMVYEADGLTVDLRFDSQAYPNKVHLIGQVLDKRVPRTSVGDAHVMLWTDQGLPIVETRTNGLGEFTLEFADLDNLKLSIQVGRTHIRIPLPNLTARQNAAEARAVTNRGLQV